MKINTTRFVPIVVATSSLFTAVLPATAKHHETASASEPRSYIDASTSALEAMLKLPMDEPIHMLNMIRFKGKAEYEEGSEFAAKGWTGAQACAEYRKHVFCRSASVADSRLIRMAPAAK